MKPDTLVSLSRCAQHADYGSDMRVAIAHDWLVGYAGSERCVEQMLEAFPGARLVTTVVEPSVLPQALRRAEPSFLQRVPGTRRHHEWFLPLMPLAWRLADLPADLDAVISSSHACAKAVAAARGTPHLCYCYTPMRYAWNFHAEHRRFPAPLRPLARAGMAWFRSWDRGTADRVDRFVAISSAVAERIRRSYGRSAQVIHPPVRTDFFTPGAERGEDFLYVGRLVSYKRADLLVEAFTTLPHRLLIVGQGQLSGRLRARATANVRFLGEVGDAELRDLYRSARALVFPGEEDFGIVMAEAQACGTPVIALAAGGAPDIVEPGVTGWLLERQHVDDVRSAVRRAADVVLDPEAIRNRAERFSSERFRRELRAAVEELVAVKSAPANRSPRQTRRCDSRAALRARWRPPRGPARE
jgi:glycosyltransferase involved in cell wall biosynthesis